MKRATETRAKSRSFAVLVVALAVLAGCDEALSPDAVSSDASTADAQNNNPVELFPDASAGSGKTVEAPEVFNVTEAGLWDGRPSLGGIWVAHPDVTQPERVVIKNTANNKSINGALFRRERNLPGPALQLSSAAAEQLGILAGSPTKVEVIALRRKPVEKKEAEPEKASATQTATNASTDKDAKNEDNAVETASAEGEKPAKRKWWQKKETVAVAGAAGATAAAASDTASDATEATSEKAADTSSDSIATEELSETEATQAEGKPAKRKWWQKKETVAATGTAGAAAAATAEDATEAAPAPVEEAVEAPTETTPTASLSDPEVTPPEGTAKKRKWWQKKDPDAITETPLDPIEGAAAAIEASAPTPVSSNAAAAEPVSRSLTKPFVQVGTFNVEENAQSAASKIERNGIPARVRELKTGDKTVWRVLVGPANSRSERNAMQSDVKDLGFTDAFTVKN